MQSHFTTKGSPYFCDMINITTIHRIANTNSSVKTICYKPPAKQWKYQLLAPSACKAIASPVNRYPLKYQRPGQSFLTVLIRKLPMFGTQSSRCLAKPCRHVDVFFLFASQSEITARASVMSRDGGK